MAKKSSALSRCGKLISGSDESIFSKPLNKRQKVLARIAKRQLTAALANYSSKHSEAKGVGPVIKKSRLFPPTKMEDVAGCLEYKGRPKSLREMEEAIPKMVQLRHKQGRY